MTVGQVWRATIFGHPIDVLRRASEELLPPPEGWAVVRVAAAGIALPDIRLIEGSFPGMVAPPVTPGQEVSGEVVAARPDSPFVPGDRVMGLTPFMYGWGGCGEFAYIVEDKAVLVPHGMSDVEAAGFPIAFRTAHAAFVERVPLSEGQTVIILGASGSSGTAAIQLAKVLGARVIAVTSGKERSEFCRSIGADDVVDRRVAQDLVSSLRKAAGGSGADVLFDPVGGEIAITATQAIAKNGRVAIVGNASGNWICPDPLDLLLRNYSVSGVFAGGFTVAEDQAAFSHLVSLAEQGRIRTPIGQVWDFDDVPKAVAALTTASPGKSVVKLR